jgi:hypothetical protein
MKLSTLVNYRSELDAMSADPIGQTADKEIEKITYLTKKSKHTDS